MLTISFCIDWRKTHNSREVHILSDCQSAISSVTSSDLHRSHQDDIDDIRRGVQDLDSQSTTVILHWIAGNVDSNGNELTDKAAKEAAIEASTLPKSLTESYTDVCGYIKEEICPKWQQTWNRSSSGGSLFQYIPTVIKGKYKSSLSKDHEARLIRAKTGHNKLKAHLHKLNFVDTHMCDCGEDMQNIEHVFVHCPPNKVNRNEMIDTIELEYVRCKTPFHGRNLHLTILLHPNHTAPQTRHKINIANLPYRSEFVASPIAILELIHIETLTVLKDLREKTILHRDII